MRTFVQYSIADCGRPKAASEVMSSRFVRVIILDNDGTFRDIHLNRFRELQSNAVAFSTVFFAITSDRKQLVKSQTILEIYEPLTL